MQDVYAKARLIKLAAFDVDGVLTDGSLYLTDGGEEIKAFNSLDGHGLKMLRESGVELAIITGRKSNSVALRAKNLGIELLYQGVDDKAPNCSLRAGSTPPPPPTWVTMSSTCRC